MKKQKLLSFFIILLIIIAIIVVGGYFYLTNTKVTEEPSNTEVSGSLVENTDTFNSTDSASSTATTTTTGKLLRLRQLTTTPVAGYDFVTTTNGYVIWYIDSANGHIFKASTSTLDIIRVTNTTIPKVYEAFIGKGGANVILRTLNESTDRIQTFIGTPKRNASSTELVGVFTGDQVSFLSLSPTKDSFFGATSGAGNIYSMTGKATNVFNHPLKKWIPQWVTGSTVLMTSAPSAKTQNISYFLNTSTKAFTKVLGPKNGMVVSSSPNAAKLLYSENKSNTLVFGVYDTKTEAETTISAPTIPDKCVWSKKDPSLVYCGFPKNLSSGAYPDDWYQGKTLFNDNLRSLDLDTFQFNTISDLQSASGEQIDATKLMLSSDEKYLLFTNKADLTLWMIEL